MKVWKVTMSLILCGLIWGIPPLSARPDNIKKRFAPISTAVPSLSIAPDARGGGMGDNGVSTTPDFASQYWNPAKYVFQSGKGGAGFSYTPWLRSLVNDMGLAYLSGYYKIGDSDLQAIGSSIRYFTLGDLDDFPVDGGAGIRMNPYELAIDVSYSRKLSRLFSMSVAIRYIRSDMDAPSDSEMVPDDAFSADIAGFLEKYVLLGRSECLWTFGFNVANIGTKVSYNGGETSFFLPATLRVGTGLLFPVNNFNRLGVYLDLSKYLVPNEPVQRGTSEEDIADYERRWEHYQNISPVKGMFRSFSDNPQGFSGELKEINLSLGVEYSYNNQFFVRSGYYHENKNLGNRQYVSMGAGFRMSVFQLDAAYLVSTVHNNPLDQTLRFSLSFNMDGIKKWSGN